MSKKKKTNKSIFDHLSEREIVELYHEMENKKTGRNASYKTLEKVFNDNEYVGALESTLSSEIVKSERRKLLVNIIKPRVRDKVGILVQEPEIKVSVPQDLGEDGLTYQQAWTLMIHGYWDFSKMTLNRLDMGYYLSLLGTSVEQVVPDMKNEYPRIVVRHPGTCYAESKSGNSKEYLFVFFIWKSTGRQILASYPQAEACGVDRSDTEYTMVEAIDENHRLFFANDKKIPGVGIKHDWGFIPVRVTPNIKVPQKMEGLSDVDFVLGLQENISELLQLSTQQMRNSVYPDLFLRNAKHLPADLSTGLSSIIKGGKESDASYLSSPNSSRDVSGEVQMQMNLLRQLSNWSIVRSGIPTAGTVTSKGVNSLLQGSSDEASTTFQLIASDLVDVNNYCMEIDRKVFGKKKQKAAGRYKNQDFGLSYIPKEDIPEGGISNNIVFVPLGYDISTMIVNLLQMYQGGGGRGILDLRSVLERIPGINPNEVITRLEEDMQRRFKWESAAQTMMQQVTAPQEQQEIPPEAIEKAAYAMEQGGMPQGQPAPMGAPAGPPPGASPGAPAGPPTPPAGAPPGVPQ